MALDDSRLAPLVLLFPFLSRAVFLCVRARALIELTIRKEAGRLGHNHTDFLYSVDELTITSCFVRSNRLLDVARVSSTSDAPSPRRRYHSRRSRASISQREEKERRRIREHQRQEEEKKQENTC